MKRISIRTAMLAMAMMVTGSIMAQNDITLTVKNVPDGEGKVMIASSKGHAMAVDAKDNKVEVVLKDVPNGILDIYAFHDANGNKNLDMDGIIPQEYCAVGQFDVQGNTKNIELTLEYIPERIKK